MPDHASQEREQSPLYLDLTDNYVAVTRATWKNAETYRAANGKFPEGYNGWDYLLMATLDGVEYWLPNDEEWFDVVAVDHTNKIAEFTGFCEMDDFEHENSDYRFTMDPADGQLKCKFSFLS